MQTLDTTNGSAVPALEMRGISKRFDATQALDNASLVLYPGEIHALLGENGAGKSTLIKITTGMHVPDSGQIFFDGQPIEIENAAQAQRLGIAAIYQEPRIFPDLNVAENIFIAQRGTWRSCQLGQAVCRCRSGAGTARRIARRAVASTWPFAGKSTDD